MEISLFILDVSINNKKDDPYFRGLARMVGDAAGEGTANSRFL